MRFHQFILICCALLTVEVARAAEIPADIEGGMLTQVAKYVVGNLEKAITTPRESLTTLSQKIDDGASQGKTERRIARMVELIKEVEKDAAKNVRLALIEPPHVIDTNEDAELTLLVFFNVKGDKLKFGVMTLKVSGAHQKEDKIHCHIQVGHLALSMKEFGSD